MRTTHWFDAKNAKPQIQQNYNVLLTFNDGSFRAYVGTADFTQNGWANVITDKQSKFQAEVLFWEDVQALVKANPKMARPAIIDKAKISADQAKVIAKEAIAAEAVEVEPVVIAKP